jgi:hypothetical protein
LRNFVEKKYFQKKLQGIKKFILLQPQTRGKKGREVGLGKGLSIEESSLNYWSKRK